MRIEPIRLMLLLIMVVVLATYSMANPSKITDPAESLVGYWPLNGNVEDEIGGHNGKLLGGAKFVKDADRDQVLEVDGKDGRAEVPHADDLSFSAKDSYTLTVWVHVLTKPGHWAGIVTKSRDKSPWYGLWLNGSNQLVAGGDNITGSEIVDKKWLHLALVQDGVTNKRIVYRNGIVEKMTGTTTAIDGVGKGNLWMGGAGGVSEYLHARIDDVAIYKSVLTPVYIKKLAGGENVTTAVDHRWKLATTWSELKRN